MLKKARGALFLKQPVGVVFLCIEILIKKGGVNAYQL